MQPFPIAYQPQVPYPQMVLRVRKEVSTRDSTNVRQFEHWQTDGPSLNLDRPDLSGNPVFGDMNPIVGRRVASQLYRQAPTYTPGKDDFAQNPYFNTYAPSYDPRNAIRELQGTVFEDVGDRGINESKKLLSRGFDNVWVPPEAIQGKNLTSLRAYEDLKPRFDDPNKDYRKK
jgi:hypothetical protein